MVACFPWYGAATHPPTDSTQVQSPGEAKPTTCQVNMKDSSRIEAIMVRTLRSELVFI